MCEVCFGQKKKAILLWPSHTCMLGGCSVADDGYATPPHRSPTGAPVIILPWLYTLKIKQKQLHTLKKGLPLPIQLFL